MTNPGVFVCVCVFLSLPFSFARQNKKWSLFLFFLPAASRPLIYVAMSTTLKITSIPESLKCFSQLAEKHDAAISAGADRDRTTTRSTEELFRETSAG